MDRLLLDRDGNVLLPTVRKDKDGKTWVGLLSDPAILEPDSYSFLNIPTTRRSLRENDFGRINEGLEGAVPDVYHPHNHWALWTPVKPKSPLSKLWYFHSDGAYTTVREGDKWKLDEEMLKRYQDTHDEISRCVYAIADGPKFQRDGPFPSPFDFTRIPPVFDYVFESEIHRLITELRRTVLDMLGFINWWINSVSEWEKGLPANRVASIISFKLELCEKRGGIVVLPRNFADANFPHWAEHNVPIWYPWDEAEESDVMFALLAPHLYQMYYAAVEQGGSADFLGSDIPELHSRLQLFSEYDGYLQRSNRTFFSSTDTPSPIPKEWGFFLIDGWRWKRRYIEDEELRQAYLELFHFRVFHVKQKNGKPGHIVICYRWQPRNPTFRVASKEPWVTESEIREVWKATHAPKPGQIYDEETGRSVRDPLYGPEGLTRLDEEIKAGARMRGKHALYEGLPLTILPYVRQPSSRSTSSSPPLSGHANNAALYPHATAAGPMDVDTPSRPQTTDNADGKSLLERLKFHARPLPTEPRADREANLRNSSPHHAGSDTMSTVSSVTVSSTSTATPSLAKRLSPFQSSPTSETPLNELKTFWLQKFMRAPHHATVIPSSGYIRPTSYNWNPLLLEKGVLVLPPYSEIKMRLWANAYPGISKLEDVLNLAIQRRLKFSIGVLRTDLDLFRDPNEKLSPVDLAPTHHLYDNAFVDHNLTFVNEIQFARRYLGTSGEILKRIHAASLKSEGGTISWLTDMLGGEHLTEKLVQGPGPQTTRHNKGGSDGGDIDAKFIQYDQPSAAEIHLLLGRVSYGDPEKDKSLWPSTEILMAESNFYWGEWNERMDALMEGLWDEFVDGTYQIRTRAQWREYVRGNNRFGGARGKPDKPTLKVWKQSKTELTRAFGMEWSKRALKSIAVPELFQPDGDLESQLEHDYQESLKRKRT